MRYSLTSDESLHYHCTAEEILVVGDLHGDLERFESVVQYWRKRKRKKDVALVFLGDLVHAKLGRGSDPASDNSFEILKRLRDLWGPRCFSLLGNHEIMHLYQMDVTTQSGKRFVVELEEAWQGERAQWIEFLMAFPVSARWGNVVLNHVGASEAYLRSYKKPALPFLKAWKHSAIWAKLSKKAGVRTKDLEFVHDLFDGDLGGVLLNTKTGELIWQLMFTKNEKQFGASKYLTMLEEMRETYAVLYEMPISELECIVTGHIPTGEAARNIAFQLRLDSVYSVRSTAILRLSEHPVKKKHLESGVSGVPAAQLTKWIKDTEALPKTFLKNSLVLQIPVRSKKEPK